MRTRYGSPPPSARSEAADVNEQQLLDELELVQQAGAKVLDWHTCDLFPERWVDLVVVLRCDHSQLWSRLEKRYVRIHLPSKACETKPNESHRRTAEDTR